MAFLSERDQSNTYLLGLNDKKGLDRKKIAYANPLNRFNHSLSQPTEDANKHLACSVEII